MSSTQTVADELATAIKNARQADVDVCGAYDIRTADGERFTIEVSRVVSR
jgi:hypothetical protein